MYCHAEVWAIQNRHFFRLSAAATLMAVAMLALGSFADRGSTGCFLVSAAHAQPEEDFQRFQKDVQQKLEPLHQKLQSLVERLRHGDMPEGIAKTNGRIEATEIDVSSKYARRLESVTVNEGDEVKAGRVVARIYSPEYEAQLHSAQAKVLVAKGVLAAAEAQIAQRKADQVFAKRDLERGQQLVGQGSMTKQVFDQRVDKADAAAAALLAAKRSARRQVPVQSTEAEVEQISSILAENSRSGRRATAGFNT